MKKIPLSIQDEAQTIDQYFESINCTSFFKHNNKSNTIEIYLDNPSEPSLPIKRDHAYIIS